MIKCRLFEYISPRGRGVITDWLREHPQHRGGVQARVNDLRLHGVGSEETRNWCDHERAGIYKLKIRAKPQFRPHLCKGPIWMDVEATFLATAVEEDFELDPADVLERAIRRRAEIVADPQRRKVYG